MRSFFIALGCGVLFGLGLHISGMSDTAKVIGFLDITGDWDPSLAFVMGSALLVTVLGYRLVLAKVKPICESRFTLPNAFQLDRKLLIGSALFGIGWGMVGYCPGPALASILFGYAETLVFVGSMFGGFVLHRLIFE